jgi:two-component system chemotaxis sensor kinase CheA
VPDQSFDQMRMEFVADASDKVDDLTKRITGLDRNQSFPRPLVDEIFRVAHSLRGTAGMFGLDEVSVLAGYFENLLEAVRAEKIAVTQEVTDLVIEVLDELSSMLRGAGDGQPDGRNAPNLPTLDLKIRQVLARPESTGRKGEVGLGGAGPAASVHEASLSVRVDIALLDSIMNTVSELFSTRPALSAIAGRLSHTSGTQRLGDDLLKVGLLLNKRLLDLQSAVMEARLVPVSALFDRYTVEVRRLARFSRKEVDLSLEGEATRVDRAMLDKLYDPLLHIIRNAVDHGLEPPEERARAGKPSRGRLVLRAREESGHVLMEVEDDGRGVDMDRVRSVAAARGLEVPDADSAVELLFMPGFTTKQERSDISGRGVGLDAVRAQVEEMKGIVTLRSERGEGTRVSLWLPLTLAISRGMLVEENGTAVVVPLGCVEEVLRFTEAAAGEIARTGRIQYRGRAVKTIDLSRMVCGLPPRSPRSMVIIGVGGRKRAIVVERVCGETEIINRPLPEAVGGPGFITGATELHDGRPALVIGPEEILRTRPEAESRLRGRESGNARQVSAAGALESDGSLRTVVIRQASGLYGLPTMVVREILPGARVTPVPVLGDAWQGLFFVKGACHGLLAISPNVTARSPDEAKVITLHIPERCGVWADEILGEVQVPSSDLSLCGDGCQGLVVRCGSFTWRGMEVCLLDTGATLTCPDARLAAGMARTGGIASTGTSNAGGRA